MSAIIVDSWKTPWLHASIFIIHSISRGTRIEIEAQSMTIQLVDTKPHEVKMISEIIIKLMSHITKTALSVSVILGERSI